MSTSDKEQEVFLRVKKTTEGLLQISREKNMAEAKEITEQTNLYDDLGIDSLEVMDLIASLEEEFGVTVEMSEMTDKRTVGQIVEYFAEKV